MKNLFRAACAMLVIPAFSAGAEATDPLPSWRDAPSRTAIIEFVEEVSNPDSASFIPPRDRVAVFDNDGTLWSEQPLYFQLLFAIDRVKAMAPENPQWEEQEPFASILKGNVEQVLAGGDKAMMDIIFATHAHLTTAQFESVIRDWLADARHPTTGLPYTSMVYQPMLELLDYLRDNRFRNFIVSGGGVEFMRLWVEQFYGIPRERVIGSSIKTEFSYDENGKPVLKRLPEIDFINDKEGKPEAINKQIGRRPVIAVGNSDGDLQMLQWAAAGEGPSLQVLVHHTDADREWAYDRESAVGRLNDALDQAGEDGWTVINMRDDWAAMYPAQD